VRGRHRRGGSAARTPTSCPESPKCPLSCGKETLLSGYVAIMLSARTLQKRDETWPIPSNGCTIAAGEPVAKRRKGSLRQTP
jgi:hypothetical protein